MLARCIASSTITQISVLSRRPVKQVEGVDKAKVFIHKDFKVYPQDLLDKLKGASGCIWALGVPSSQASARFSVCSSICYEIPLWLSVCALQ